LSSGVVRDEIVHAGFRGDGGGGQPVVAGDHHRADAHATHRVEARAHPRLDDVFQFDRAEQALVSRHHQRGAAGPRDALHRLPEGGHRLGASRAEHGVHGALAVAPWREVEARHAALRGEGHHGRVHRCSRCLDAPPVAGEAEDGAALGRLVSQGRQHRGLGQILRGHARCGNERGRLTVAERDGAGLVERQHVHIPGGLHRPPGGRQHVEPHQPVHAGDADGGEQPADRGWDQRDEQGREHRNRGRPPVPAGQPHEGCHCDQEDDRHPSEQDIERDLVRRLLPARALDEGNHAVQERGTGGGGDAHDDPVGDDERASGDCAPIATALADHRRSRR
jgi:hypothetical protein